MLQQFKNRLTQSNINFEVWSNEIIVEGWHQWFGVKIQDIEQNYNEVIADTLNNCEH